MIGAATVLAQNEQSVTRISVGDASAAPGESVVVPITFEPAENAKVREVKLTIDYRSAHLEFLRMDRGPASDPARVDLRLQDLTTAGEGRQQYSKLTIVASLVPALQPQPLGAPAEGISGGRLAELSFRIDDEGDSAIYLDSTASVTEVGSNTPLASRNVQAREGVIYVLTPGGLGCFFFTH
jgi:hypothetical protein